MENKVKYPKCKRTERAKDEFCRENRRYKCKNCGCNYTRGRNDYSDHVKQQNKGIAKIV